MNAKIVIAIVATIALVGAGVFFLVGDLNNSDITYDLDGGMNADSNPTNYSGVPIALQDPLKKGYSFGGWYADEELTEEMSVVSPDDGKIKVYAKWVLEEYTIDYQLNGGMMSSDNPSTYTVEDKVVLNSPKKIMMTFSGWYTDQSLSADTRVTDINTMSGDLTLYAGYDTVVGNKYVYEISGTYAGLDVSGNLSVSYSAYINEQYLLVEEEMMKMHTADGEVIDWPSYFSTFEKNGFVRGGNFDRTETIAYLGRQQTVDVYKDSIDRLIGYDYLLDGTTVARSTISGTLDGEKIDLTYDLVNISTFVPKDEYTVMIHYGNGLSSVKGTGTYGVGEKVTLSAVTRSGVTFEGWCDRDGNIYEESKTITIDAIGSDVILCAFCEDDVFISTPGSASYYDAKWIVEEKYTGKYVATVYGNPAICNMPDVGEYLCKFTGTNPDGHAYSYTMDKLVDGSVEREYYWTYDGWSYGMVWTTPYSTYVDYKELDTTRRHTTNAQDAKFVTYTNNTISVVSDFLLEESAGMNRLQRADFILQFVEDTIAYQYDEDGVGYDEYWKYPVETLFEKKGDCEDTAILYAALMKAAGYDVALLRFSDHMAVGIVVSGAYGTYYEEDGKRYFYCETTGDAGSDWTVGDAPSNYKKSTNLTII